CPRAGASSGRAFLRRRGRSASALDLRRRRARTTGRRSRAGPDRTPRRGSRSRTRPLRQSARRQPCAWREISESRLRDRGPDRQDPAMEEFRIGIVLWDGVEELDFAGPYEVLTAWARGSERPITVTTVARSTDPVTCSHGLRVTPD